MNKKFWALGIVFLLIIGVVGYFYRVNAVAQKFPQPYPYEPYAVGDKVDLSGTAVEYLDQESRDGYSITATKIERCTLKEYLDKYGHQDYSYPPYQELKDDPTKSILCVSYSIENLNNSEGAIDLFGMSIVPLPSKDMVYIFDDELFPISETKLKDGSGVLTSVHTTPGSTYEVHVPYVNNGNAPGIYRQPISSTDEFEILCSNTPVKKVIIGKVSQ